MVVRKEEKRNTLRRHAIQKTMGFNIVREMEGEDVLKHQEPIHSPYEFVLLLQE